MCLVYTLPGGRGIDDDDGDDDDDVDDDDDDNDDVDDDDDDDDDVDDDDRDVNGIIKNSLKMLGSRGRIGPGGVKGQRPCGGPRGAMPPGRN